jgi:predicted nucleic acid-binding protein
VAILVDTGALELLRRRSKNVEELALRSFPPVICTHVAAEFLYGQISANVSPPSLLQAQEFLNSFEILAPGLSTAAIYARIRSDLKAAGRKLPNADYWIAAHAIEGRMSIVSTDHHFKLISEVSIHLVPVPIS